jgi:ribosomal protein S18 acetylase RimI-like enzyme
MTLPGQQVLPVVRAALARGQHVRMTVNGNSMWPVIHDADSVEIRPQRGAPARADVVLAESAPARYVVHRVARVQHDGLWLCGDAQPRAEGPVPVQQVLGTVIRAVHAGRVRVLERGVWRWAGLVCMCCRPLPAWLGALRIRLRNAAARALGCVHGTALVRAVLRRCRPAVRVREATQEESQRIAAWLVAPAARDVPDAAWQTPHGLNNYVAASNTRLLGFVRLMRHPADAAPRAGCWLYSLTVRTRYRGMGIGEQLVRHVLREAAATGAQELLLTVFEDNHPARALYQKLGFERVTIAALEQELADDVARYGRRRMVMRTWLP